MAGEIKDQIAQNSEINSNSKPRACTWWARRASSVSLNFSSTVPMSLKRKAVASKEQGSTGKKQKFDFFAPRTSSGNGLTFKFNQKPENATRLITWNVNGIKSVDDKV